MPIRDLLKKKDKVAEHDAPGPEAGALETPIFKIFRSDTNTQEMISPPTFSSSESSPRPSVDGPGESRTSRLFKTRHRSASAASGASVSSRGSDKSRPKTPTGEKRRLSQRLHLRKSEATSASVPTDLPTITLEDDGTGGEGAESQWEKRATILAKKNEESRSRPTTPVGSTTDLGSFGNMRLGEGIERPKSAVSSKLADDNIQEAIRLHEAGDLETSTKMFGRLADPNGENNALSQVLYGLALRHGWGCTPDAAEAVTYLSAAASNAASIEELALKAGMKKGGAAKGELYYETAANLGDTDAMNEVGWCYIEGFGCKKDKYAAAKYYRLAEQGGSKTLGNSWIWKEKYNPSTAGNANSKK